MAFVDMFKNLFSGQMMRCSMCIHMLRWLRHEYSTDSSVALGPGGSG